MTNIKDNLPLYEEQQIIPEEQVAIQTILNKFSTPIPNGFVKLENLQHMCSTQGWKEPVCERYGLTQQGGEWIQLDIPHTLMEELELKQDKEGKYGDITQPLYLDAVVLTRLEDRYKGITIKNAEELFLQKPLTINNLEKELTNWLEELKVSREKTGQLTTTEQLNQKLRDENQLLTIELQGEKQLSQAQKETTQAKINGLKREKEELENGHRQQLIQKNDEITELKRQIEQLEVELNARPNITLTEWNNDYSKRPTQQQLDNVQGELEREKQELQKEISWWDKWIEDKDQKDKTYRGYHMNDKLRLFLSQRLNREISFLVNFSKRENTENPNCCGWLYRQEEIESIYQTRNHYEQETKDGKGLIKEIYQYYRDK